MRIALVNWSNRLAGGIEGYLGTVGPALAAAGHELGFLYEHAEPVERTPIPLAAGSPGWDVRVLTQGVALEALATWQPDVLYVHAIDDPQLERQLVTRWPAVGFVHQYRGTCISGSKTFSASYVRPCDRRFGLPCLAFYYPRRCGGLSPLTMVTDYRRQSVRLDTLRRYRSLVTHSEHMRAEYVKHGIPPERVMKIPYVVRPSLQAHAPEGVSAARLGLDTGRPVKLLFVGRMETLKGGGVLIDALPAARAALGRGVELMMVGDGRARAAWEEKSRAFEARFSDIRVQFTGWMDGPELEDTYRASDLVVMPSLWPEPFGMVGLEAGRFGVPAAAFAVGGITEWLRDGVNGCVAAGDPPTAKGLARAITRCLGDPVAYRRMSEGALAAVESHRLDVHVTALVEILQAARAS